MSGSAKQLSSILLEISSPQVKLGSAKLELIGLSRYMHQDLMKAFRQL